MGKNTKLIVKLILINIIVTMLLLSVNVLSLLKKTEFSFKTFESVKNYYDYNFIDETQKSYYEEEFLITAYCDCEKCCGKTDGITASGTKVKENHTIAVDTSVIPFGTVVEIEGVYYVAEDTGGLINENRIDIYFETHKEALEFGVKTIKVKIFNNLY